MGLDKFFKKNPDEEPGEKPEPKDDPTKFIDLGAMSPKSMQGMMNVVECLSTIPFAKDDPEDTLFMQLTQRETYYLAAVVHYFKTMVLDQIEKETYLHKVQDDLATKFADSIQAQKDL